MLAVRPGENFEAYTDAFPTGLADTLAVRIRDGAGGEFLARTTAGITEDVTVGTNGVYRREFVAPTVAGQFWLVWDDGADTVKVEELRVVSSAAMAGLPGGRDLCEFADVVRYVPGYVSEPDTDATLQVLITAESRTIHELTGREIVAIPSTPVRKFALDEYTVKQRTLRIGDCIEATTVEVQLEDGSTVEVLDPADFSVLPFIREEWQPLRSVQLHRQAALRLLRDDRFVQVTGIWGFPSVPEDIRQACAKRVIVRYLSDVALAGTAFADVVNESGINIGALLRSSGDVITHYRSDVIA